MIGIFFDGAGTNGSIEVGVYDEGSLGRALGLGLNECLRETEGVVSWDIVLGDSPRTYLVSIIVSGGRGLTKVLLYI